MITYLVSGVLLVLILVFITEMLLPFKLEEGPVYIRNKEMRAFVLSIVITVLSLIGWFVTKQPMLIALVVIFAIIAILMFVGLKSTYDKFGNRRKVDPRHEDIVF